MNQSVQAYLDKAHCALAAARRDLDAEDAENAIARAYFGAYYAVAATLRTRGVSAAILEEGNHDEVHTQFYQHVVGPHLLSRETGRTLALLYQLFKHAAYLDEPFLSTSDAEEALGEAQTLVGSVRTWLETAG